MFLVTVVVVNQVVVVSTFRLSTGMSQKDTVTTKRTRAWAVGSKETSGIVVSFRIVCLLSFLVLFRRLTPQAQ